TFLAAIQGLEHLRARRCLADRHCGAGLGLDGDTGTDPVCGHCVFHRTWFRPRNSSVEGTGYGAVLRKCCGQWAVYVAGTATPGHIIGGGTEAACCAGILRRRSRGRGDVAELVVTKLINRHVHSTSRGVFHYYRVGR